jgi:hypothetical protein
VLKRAHVALDEDLLGLVVRDEMEGSTTGREAHHEHPGLHHDALEHEGELAEVNFGFFTQGMRLGTRDLSNAEGSISLRL